MSRIKTSRLRNSRDRTLSQSPGLSLRLQQCQDVSLSHGALHVPDDLTVSLTNELHLDLRVRKSTEITPLPAPAYLGTLTLGASPAQNLDDPREGDAGLVHADALLCNTDNPSDPP